MATVSKNFKVKNGLEAGSTIFSAASTTAAASLNIPHGTAPTSPTNGDFWTTSSGAYVRINGVTVGPLASSAGAGTTWGAITGTLSSQTDLQTALDAKLNLSGGTLTGNVTISKGIATFNITSTSGDAYARISRLAGNGGYYEVHTNGVRRWVLGADTASESGSNAGSNFALYSYTDAGALAATAIHVNRSTSAVTLAGGLTVSGNIAVTKDTPIITINGSGYANPAYYNVYRAAGQFGGMLLSTGSTSRWLVAVNNTSESGSDAGSDFVVKRYSDAGAGLGDALTITRSTGKAVFSGILEAGTSIGITSGPTWVNDAGKWRTSSALRVDGAIYAISTLRFGGTADVILQRDAALTLGSNSDITITKAAPRLTLNSPTTDTRYIRFNTNANYRWAVGANSTTESGSNAGSDFVISSFADNSAVISTPLTITRATGLTTFTGDQLVQKANPYIQVNATSGTALVTADSVAGSASNFALRTGNSYRWIIGKNTTAESGSDAGSNLEIRAYADNGSTLLSTPLTITRSTGNATFSGSITATSFSGTAVLSGTPTAPTAAVDTNTTQIATTAYVIGQGYLKSATASSTYAPIASPTFTGTVTTPGVKRNVVTKSALYTLTASDHIVIATSGTWTATLPTAASIAGTEYIIKNSGSGIITVDPAGTETIDGSTTIDLAQYDSLTVVSDGTNWVIV